MQCKWNGEPELLAAHYGLANYFVLNPREQVVVPRHDAHDDNDDRMATMMMEILVQPEANGTRLFRVPSMYKMVISGNYRFILSALISSPDKLRVLEGLSCGWYFTGSSLRLRPRRRRR